MQTPWREHPDLKGRFLPNHPDDLQVIVHDGGPRITDKQPELVWVTVVGIDNDVFEGKVLNQPAGLTTIHLGEVIRFVAPPGCNHPILVTEKYLREREDWLIQPCDKCGCLELFDAPSDLIRAIFPNFPAGHRPEVFTSFCPLCGGVQVVVSKDSNLGREDIPANRPKKKWWEFWK